MLLALASGGAGALLAVHYDGHITIAVSAPPVSASAGSPAARGLAAVAAAVEPSVVTISVRTATSSGEGSGVIIGSDGTILTNNHVIEAAADGAGALTVTFSNGQTAQATIIGRNSSADLAVIRATGVSGLTPAAFGSAAALHVGDTVLAVGSPLGLAGSVTSGIIWSPPAANAGLWEFRNVAITSYNGTRGTICGPWPAEKHLAAPVITVRMIPSDLSDSCRAFSVLLKGTS